MRPEFIVFFLGEYFRARVVIYTTHTHKSFPHAVLYCV